MRSVPSVPGFLLAVAVLAQDAPLRLQVDATDATRRVFHARMTVPVQPGPVTLIYAKWIPGHHRAHGPIVNLVGLYVKSGGAAVPWTRDSVNMYAFHVTAPAGAQSLDVAFDYLVPGDGDPNVTGSSAYSTTTQLAVMNWNQVLLYPEGIAQEKLQVEASLKIPAGWKYGTALPVRAEAGREIQFQPVSLERLIDSPLSMGVNYRTIELDGKHFIHVAADSTRALEFGQDVIQGHKNLVVQAGKLFGTRHYASYHFLLTLSDHVRGLGLEHHESSDNRVGERTIIDDAPRKINADLLPHEFTHSWNGKFRRPAGLATGGFENPMQGDLLWVYEGLTNYLGEVLAARSGLWTAEDYRNNLAQTAARMDGRSGRAWRPLADTATASQLLYLAGDDYSDYRRGPDYYPEGSLLWLDVDVKIRQLSRGAKSLDDFCQLFHGGAGGRPEVKPYGLEDMISALNQVQPFDWAAFFEERVYATAPRAPLGGISGSGWKLIFDDQRSSFWKAGEEANKQSNYSFSIGLTAKNDGRIVDIVVGGVAQKSGVTPSTKIIAVNRRQFTQTVLREAIQKTAAGEKLELLVKVGEFYETFALDYAGGERYPHLVRVEAAADLLSAVVAARK